MRKILIAAVAALTAVFMATGALAQSEEAAMDISVSPKNAGTKKKPKNSELDLNIENFNTSRTLSEIVVTTPKTLKLSTKGLTSCSESTLSSQGLAGCKRSARVGKGTARALVGVNTGNPKPLTFKVTAVVTGSKGLGFFLEAQELPINVLAPGRISGRKLSIEVPQAAQQPAPGTYAGLVEIDTTLKAKKGKRKLLSSVGCKGGEHELKAVLTFVDNGVTEAGEVPLSASAPCKK